MKAVILTAGDSSRFYPFNTHHKSMVEIMGKPILEHTICALKKANIRDIIIVKGIDNFISDHFGSGEKYGVKIEYVVQKKALGAGNALLLTREKLEDDFLLLNGYRVDIDCFIQPLLDKKTKKAKAVLLVKKNSN